MATTGKILRFDEIRGYGFIAPDDGGEDVFMHANDLRDNKHLFRPGIKVEFEVEDGERGLKAAEVRLAGVPSLTAAQITQVRRRLVELAQAHNWVES